VLHSVTGPGPVITTTAPGVAVPDIVGVVVTVGPVGVTVRLGGATAVRLTVAGVDTPPGLLARAVSVCGPTGKLTRHDQAPVGEAVVAQSCPNGPVSVTEAFGVAVPDTTGVWLASVLVSGLLIATVGTATAVNVMGCELLPPGPAAVTVSVFGPTGTEIAQAYVPDTEAVVLHSVTGPGPVIVTRLPGVAVPATTGVVAVDTFTGELTVKLAGAMAVKLSITGVDTPPILAAMAVTEAGPAANVRLEQA
jgi:hypothetical protein